MAGIERRAGEVAARLWRSLRDGDWITRRRILVYSLLLLAADALVVAWSLTGHGIDDPAGRPVGSDFLSFWSVSAALWHDKLALVYQPAALAAWEQSLAGGAPGFYAWFYPPMALFLVAPLALLPYLWSLAAWLAVGLAAYLATLWRILPSRLGLLAGCAFPAVFVTLGHGQNAFLTTSLMGCALLLLERRPALAGVLIGLVAVKPQLAILVPLAFAFGGHWRAIGAAAAAMLVLAAASLIIFGPAIWSDFLASTAFTRQSLETGAVPFAKLQSVFAGVRLLGGGVSLAYGAQVLAAAAAAAAVGWAWHRPGAQDLKKAALIAGGLLATPFLLDYDLLLLALPIAWMARRVLEDGGRGFEKSSLALASALPLFARPLGVALGVPLTPVVLAGLLALLLRRIAAEDATPRRAEAWLATSA